MFSIIYVEGLCEICNRPNNEASEGKASRETQDLLFFPAFSPPNKPFDNISIFYLPLFNSAVK
jgi:hypothetical protein